jgi:hypothetical protein
MISFVFPSRFLGSEVGIQISEIFHVRTIFIAFEIFMLMMSGRALDSFRAGDSKSDPLWT